MTKREDAVITTMITAIRANVALFIATGGDPLAVTFLAADIALTTAAINNTIPEALNIVSSAVNNHSKSLAAHRKKKKK